MKSVAVTYRRQDRASRYAAVLRTVGLEPVLVSPPDGVESLVGFGGLLLTGGTDVNPRIYGQEPEPRTESADDERDTLEQRLLRNALERNIPVLAICRGMQLLNVTHRGGSLEQHIEGHATQSDDPSEAAHTISLTPGTVLHGILGAGDHPVNSRHHQAVRQPGTGLIVSARAADGVIEAIERPDARFVVAVQWHPEDQVRRFPEQMRLFEAFRGAVLTTGSPGPCGPGSRAGT